MFLRVLALKRFVVLAALVAVFASVQGAYADHRHHHGHYYAGSGCKSHPVFGHNPGHHKQYLRDNRYRQVGYYDDDRYYSGRRSPVLNTSLAGAAIGASTGAVLGKPILRSALIGTGFGAGLGLLRESGY